MKKLTAMICLLPLPCWSQAITGIDADLKTANMGETITFTVNLGLPADAEPRCGLSVIFGDGRVADSRIADRKDVPFVITHAYSKLGTYPILVEGKMLWRGLNTVGPCGGRSSVAVNVVDMAVEQAAKEDRAAEEAVDRTAKEAADAKAMKDKEAKPVEATLKPQPIKPPPLPQPARSQPIKPAPPIPQAPKPQPVKPQSKDDQLKVF